MSIVIDCDKESEDYTIPNLVEGKDDNSSIESIYDNGWLNEELDISTIPNLVEGKDSDSSIGSVCDDNQFNNISHENNVDLNSYKFKQYSFVDNDTIIDMSRKEMRLDIMKR